MECIDVMIWVGRTYFKILCSSEKSCAIPARRKTHCYVHEAEWRGCCRKVPTLPHWIVPGQSKVFLAYPDNPRSQVRARIFGYFVLERTEVLTAPPRAIPLPLQNLADTSDRDGRRRRVGKCWDGSRVVSHRHVDGHWVATDNTGPEVPPATPCEDGDERRQECWDGSIIVTHRCEDGKWVETGKKCPDFPSGGCNEGATRMKECPGGGRIVTHVCIDGEWVPTGQRCPKRVPVHHTMFEHERSCSLRLQPRGIYLVDARAAEVTDRFAEALERGSLVQRYVEARSVAERSRCLREGRRLFKQITDQIATRRRRQTRIPPALRRKAELRGELVLFKKPPLMERYPKAAFRNALRINGDSLIQQISAGVTLVTVDDCDRSLAGQLAARLKTNKAFAQRVLSVLSEITVSELREKGSVRLHDLCRFSVKARKQQKGRDPRSGSEITIPAKRVTRCRVFKSLKEAAEECSCVPLGSEGESGLTA